MDALLKNLLREFSQSEMSAATHCRREARRLGAAPPADALTAVSADAQASMRAFPSEMKAVFGFSLTASVGHFLSDARQLLIDRLVERERSYRATLLGMRHGLDLVALIRDVSKEVGETNINAWAVVWLDRRTPLVERAVDQLSWFALHREVALQLSFSPMA